jgi:small basic protein
MIYPVVPVLAVLIGIGIGCLLPEQHLSAAATKLLATALLACLDTVFGGFRASLEKRFDNKMFLVGFFSNALLAAIFVFVGQRLGIDLYFVVLIIFGVRIFQNLSLIRRRLLTYGRSGK